MTTRGLERDNLFLKEENETLKRQLAALQFELEQLKRAIYGSKRERFVPEVSQEQIMLFEQESDSQLEEQRTASGQEDIEQKAKPSGKRKPKTRNTFPAHLRREEQILLPYNHQDNFKQIGEDITEILKYTPMALEVLKIIRPRYVDKSSEEKNIHQANIPPRIIPKGLVDDSFIAGLIQEKFEYHMPIYRFVKKLRSSGVNFIKAKHCYNYVAKVGEMLQPIHELMLQQMLLSGYVQMDESSIRVLSQDKENGKLRGCMWVMNAPKEKIVLFNYRPGKEKEYAYDLLDGFDGVLQTDGNATYQGIANAPPGAKLLGKYQIQITDFINCWAHTRRKFYEAQELAPDLIHPVLADVQKLYAIERMAREQELDSAQRLALRQDQAILILKSIKEKLDQAAKKNITGPVKKAFTYAAKRWPQLCNYVDHGDWEIDTNLLENKIRALALGRKNYLFAKNDQTAQHIATFYSLIGTCTLNGIDVYKYLKWLLHKIATEKITADAVNWLPHKIDANLLA